MRLLHAAVACWVWLISPAALAVHFQPIIRVGDHAPGFPPDATFGGLTFGTDSPYLTPGGVVVFRGFVGPPYAENAIWVGHPGDLRLVARTSDPLIAGQFLDPPMANDAGEVSFATRGSLGPRIFTWKDGALSLVIAAGAPEPGGGAWNNPLGSFAINPGGRFLVFDVDAVNSTWTFNIQGGAPFNPAVFNGDAVSGFPGFIWTQLGAYEGALALSRANTLGLVGVIKRLGLPFDERVSIASVSAAGPHRVLSTGDPAPGFPGLTVSLPQWSRAINDANQGVVSAALNGAGVTAANGSAYWFFDGQGLSPLIRRGSPVPGPGSACAFSVAYSTSVNAQGNIAMWATVTGPGVVANVNDAALLIGPPGNLRRVFQLGDEVAPGVRIASLPIPRGSSLNRSGRFAFTANVTAAAGAGRSIWTVDPGGMSLRNVVTEGQFVSMAPQPGATLAYVHTRVSGSGNQDGFSTFLSDDDKIAVYAYMQTGFSTSGFYLVSLPCTADVNGDARVDFLDLNIVLGQYGQSGFNLDADINHDGVVNFLDLNILLGEFGRNC